MNCKKAHRKLSAYLDGELSAKAEAAVREHIATCQTCASALEELSALGSLLDAEPGMEPRPGFIERLTEAAEAERRRAIVTAMPARWAARPAFSRVAAALMMAAGLWLGAAMGGAVSQDGSVELAGTDELLLDLGIDALAAAPPGSVTDAYLSILAESE